MTEPTYEYIKGQGWVASLNHKYYVIFHPGNYQWQNVIKRGHTYSNYQEAQTLLDQEATYFATRHPTWEFKIIPADGSEGVY